MVGDAIGMLDPAMAPDDDGMEPEGIEPEAGGAVAGCASDAVPDCMVVPAEVVVWGEPVESRPAVEDMLGWAGVS